MKYISKNLICIDPKKIDRTKKNIFFGLALIRNDLSDLIYFDKLHNEAANRKKLVNTISAEAGQFTGRDIYIFRLALSHFYSTLEFLNTRKNDIKTNHNLKTIISSLTPTEWSAWDSMIKISSSYDGKKSLDPTLNPDVGDVILLANLIRNDITYHYHGTIKHLTQGYSSAFAKTAFNSKCAYVTEIENLDKDRSYYVDLAIQDYLENKIKREIFKNKGLKKYSIEIMLGFHKVISKILLNYHKNLI